MKRFFLFIVLSTTGIVGLLAIEGGIARAQDTQMTEAHIARIRANCIEAQSSLNQLHASDALLRVNRGQLYESISTKLMTPFNNRVALHRLDGARLVAVATTYEAQLAAFRTSYQQYEEAMSRTLKINCTNQPVAFYDSVNDARTKRKKVHDDTLMLHRIIQEYESEFEVFAAQFEGGGEQ
jgi:predicted GH43/DUF377 family glycosyl hydrolase